MDCDQIGTLVDAAIDEHSFSDVVRVRHHGDVIYERAAGYTDRANRIPNTLETRYGTYDPFVTGCDAGVSFWSSYRPSEGLEFSVLSNTTDGAWPIVDQIRASVEG